MLWRGQYTKGVLFILISTSLLYWLLAKYKRSLESSRNCLHPHFFRQSPQPMWIYDRETLNFMDVNDAALNTYGYTLEEFLKMSILQIRPPEEVEPAAGSA